jgi:tRNA pseudouridine38-40 synthase
VAGRTDAGVHARGQVAHVDVPVAAWQAVVGRQSGGPEEVLVRRLAGLLARDVRVRAAAVAPPGFDARFGALWRRYTYRICDSVAGPDPLERRFVLRHPRPLDVATMDRAGHGVLGEHDFAAFCRHRAGASTVRRLFGFSWWREHAGLVTADVRADGFCHHMVRALVGACLAVGEGRRPAEWPATVLAGRAKDSAVTVVPPHGLTLEAVGYPADDQLAGRVDQTRRRRPALLEGGSAG